MIRFERVCMIIATRQVFNAGHSVAEIASVSGKSPKTIRRMLRVSGLLPQQLNRKKREV